MDKKKNMLSIIRDVLREHVTKPWTLIWKEEVSKIFINWIKSDIGTRVLEVNYNITIGSESVLVDETKT